ncbi:putative small glutamine-rich tetratricopeptide repeat-containing protein alpha [Scophthalmus maximus]|uniref:Putative small glutamine-rich tetratricopeptide repeat-containing protein alpha n=1 Tax=Scophthalmus maximus TaxID=52904 RepID=A0A2U9C1J9_SCOMX|nr:putative small glutamine-rich tetratricopeptide repeat-containing protein alpha [Scophthalmus maximus]
MQQQNPELIEQLRSQIRNRTPSTGNEEQPSSSGKGEEPHQCYSRDMSGN